MDRLYEQKERKILHGIDKPIFFIYLALVIIGLLNIYAASGGRSGDFNLALNSNATRQLIWLGISLISIPIILFIDGRWFNLLAYTYYMLAIVLLIAVIFMGHTVAGNQGWFKIMGFSIQPAEFAKITTCLALAKYIHTERANLSRNKKIIFISIAIIAIPMLLIFLQPDAGSATTFFALVLPLYREGLNSWLLIGIFWLALLFLLAITLNTVLLIIALTLVFAALIFLSRKSGKQMAIYACIGLISVGVTLSENYFYNHVLKQHHRDRIEVLLGRKTDNRGIGYNINQSKISIGSGRLFGKGYLRGTQTKFAFVPEQSTDFIFCTIGEEWGFLGSTLTVLLYTGLILRLIHIAERQYFIFSRVYIYGVAAFLFLHMFVNIGMTSGILPVIGIPLPLISYGGSALLSFTILIFIALKLDIVNKKHLF